MDFLVFLGYSCFMAPIGTRCSLTAAQCKKIRDTLRLTAQELAKEVGISANTVYRWEMGLRPCLGAPAILMRLLMDGDLEPECEVKRGSRRRRPK